MHTAKETNALDLFVGAAGVFEVLQSAQGYRQVHERRREIRLEVDGRAKKQEHTRIV